MVGAFTLHCSRAAAVAAPKGVRVAIGNQVVADAERLAPGAGESIIFDIPGRGLKAVVYFAAREVWLLTAEEAVRAGLPERPAHHTPN
jgi:hypothetical protein